MKKIILLIFLSVFLIRGYSQSDRLPDPQAFFMAIIVSDIDSSLAWYKHHLGFETLNRIDRPDRGFSQANLKRGKASIEIIELNSALLPDEILADRPPRTRIAGFFKFGFAVKKFDKWMAHLNATGVNFNGEVVKDPNTDKKMIILLDPDGNRIQLFEK